MAINNGWSHPVYFPSESDPLVQICDRRINPSWLIQSYRPEEDNQTCLFERLQDDAIPALGSFNPSLGTGSTDGHLHIIIGNDVVENYKFEPVDRNPPESATTRRTVRNRLDHYSYSYHLVTQGPNPLANRAGVRAWNGSAIAGLVRKHEVETDDPHIPHALAVALHGWYQMGPQNVGDSSSPVYSVRHLFPATSSAYFRQINGRGQDAEGPCRMGMRWAMDPSIVTDVFLNAIPDKWTRAVVRALRDYGMIVVDNTHAYNVLYGEQGIDQSLVPSLQAWGTYATYLRRVAGAGPLHNPAESTWFAWRDNGDGWGGGPPRVPYSGPLAPL